MQTRILICVIYVLCAAITAAAVVRLTTTPQDRDTIQVTANLCTAYVRYKDATHKRLAGLSGMCME